MWFATSAGDSQTCGDDRPTAGGGTRRRPCDYIRHDTVGTGRIGLTDDAVVPNGTVDNARAHSDTRDEVKKCKH